MHESEDLQESFRQPIGVGDVCAKIDDAAIVFFALHESGWTTVPPALFI